jgi:hypothetical protein
MASHQPVQHSVLIILSGIVSMTALSSSAEWLLREAKPAQSKDLYSSQTRFRMRPAE